MVRRSLASLVGFFNSVELLPNTLLLGESRHAFLLEGIRVRRWFFVKGIWNLADKHRLKVSHDGD